MAASCQSDGREGQGEACPAKEGRFRRLSQSPAVCLVRGPLPPPDTVCCSQQQSQQQKAKGWPKQDSCRVCGEALLTDITPFKGNQPWEFQLSHVSTTPGWHGAPLLMYLLEHRDTIPCLRVRLVWARAAPHRLGAEELRSTQSETFQLWLPVLQDDCSCLLRWQHESSLGLPGHEPLTERGQWVAADKQPAWRSHAGRSACPGNSLKQPPGS